MQTQELKRFQRQFGQLKRKGRQNGFVCIHVTFEGIPRPERARRSIDLLQLLIPDAGILVRIIYWQKPSKIVDSLKSNLALDSLVHYREYRGGEREGVIFVRFANCSDSAFQKLVEMHYNFELGFDPSLDVQLVVHADVGYQELFCDLYDDRGAVIYILPKGSR